MESADQLAIMLQSTEAVINEVGFTGLFMGIFGLVQEHWLGSFVLNLIGYAIIIVPVGLLIRRWKKDPLVQKGE